MNKNVCEAQSLNLLLTHGEHENNAETLTDSNLRCVTDTRPEEDTTIGF